MPFRVLRLDHVGVAARSRDEAAALFENLLGLKKTHEERVLEQGVDTVFYPAGETKLEVLLDTGTGGPIGRFIEKHGTGLHHIAFEVDDLAAALKDLKSRGVRLIDQAPRKGVEHSRIAFIHPKATMDLLVELVEFPKK